MNILVFAMDATDYKNSRSLEIYACDELARQGHEVHVICERELYYGPGEKPENLSFQALNVNQLQTDQLWEYHRACGAVDVVFATSISGAKNAIFFAKEYGCKSVVQVLDIPRFRWKYDQFKKEWEYYFDILKGADVIIANTRATVDTLHVVYSGLLDDRVRLIYYGIDTITADATIAETKTVDILTCHRFVSHKASEKLIYALALLAGEGVHPVTVMIGEGPDFAKLIDLAFFAGVAINFVGPISDKEKHVLLKRAKIAVSTDVCEDIGSLFPLEAMYSKVPVLCSNLKINRERFGVFCMMHDPFNIAQLASDIKLLLNTQLPDDRLEVAKKWVLDYRSCKVQAELTLEVFRDVVGGSSGKDI